MIETADCAELDAGASQLAAGPPHRACGSRVLKIQRHRHEAETRDRVRRSDRDANAALINWAKKRTIKWDMSETEAGDQFGCRLEIYLTDPKTEPDPEKRETEVTTRLAN
jgi:hypothetical protein